MKSDFKNPTSSINTDTYTHYALNTEDIFIEKIVAG